MLKQKWIARCSSVIHADVYSVLINELKMRVVYLSVVYRQSVLLCSFIWLRGHLFRFAYFGCQTACEFYFVSPLKLKRGRLKNGQNIDILLILVKLADLNVCTHNLGLFRFVSLTKYWCFNRSFRSSCVVPIYNNIYSTSLCFTQ